MHVIPSRATASTSSKHLFLLWLLHEVAIRDSGITLLHSVLVNRLLLMLF